MGEIDFYGSVTVGERGQIVLPSKLRRQYEINAGDKILVLGKENGKFIFLVKAQILAELLEELEERIKSLFKK